MYGWSVCGGRPATKVAGWQGAKSPSETGACWRVSVWDVGVGAGYDVHMGDALWLKPRAGK